LALISWFPAAHFRIVANANGCLSLNDGLNPTFVLLDFVDKGQVIAAGNALNGLSGA
jgi:hypothetical protein